MERGPSKPHSFRPHGTAWHRRRRSKPNASFGKQLLFACGAVAVAAWNAAPQLSSIWAIFTTPPDQVARVEQSVYYPNCSAARAAGAAPISRGEPGYREEMDGDGDGVACEPYRHW